jgi:stage V sporulation protein B
LDAAEELVPQKPQSLWRLGFSIFRESIPITLSAIVFPLLLVIDSVMVVNILVAKGVGAEAATSQYGIVSGVVGSLINLPTIIAVSLAAAVVPTIARIVKARNDDIRVAVSKKVEQAVKIVACIMIFAASIFMVFNRQIISLLYGGGLDTAEQFNLAAELLALGSALVITISLAQVFSSVCFALGKSRIPLIAMLAGGLAKVAIQWVGLYTHYGVVSVIAANAVCYLIALAIMGAAITRYCGKNLRLFGFTVLSTIMNFVFVGICYGVLLILPKGTLIFLAALAGLALVFLSLIFLFRIMRVKDFAAVFIKKK